MVYAHNLGFPRIGTHREMKKTVESYWRGEISLPALHEQGLQIQLNNWRIQSEAGLDFISVGDFSWYDHVLDTALMVGAIPERFVKAKNPNTNTTDLLFAMARGRAKDLEAAPCEMTKWFDTNYHYIVPEFSESQEFKLYTDTLFTSVKLARDQGYRPKPVILGPLTFLWLGKCKNAQFNKLFLLNKLLPVYENIFQTLRSLSVEWVQIDEPILVLDLDEEWRSAFSDVYRKTHFHELKILLTTYFGNLENNLKLATQLPVNGLHIDVCRAPEQLASVIEQFPAEKILSLGIVDGRNVWRNDLHSSLNVLEKAQAVLSDRLWIAPSCSLLHVPVDLNHETQLDTELKSWLAFAKQKVEEVALLKKALDKGEQAVSKELNENRQACRVRHTSLRLRHPDVRNRVESIKDSWFHRQSPHDQRKQNQQAELHLPLLPTTTIGSFPQTQDLRRIRRDFKEGKIDTAGYEEKIRHHIAEVIRIQESLGLDVLVHGEPERNDMVEYFGEWLEGIAITENGWVQSYGSRCVKPPIIYGDVYRTQPITIRWIEYAQSLTQKPVKGMLTGPVTITAWSFVRNDQPRSKTAEQIALALRDEVTDLEAAGIRIIQIDEPAFRESLPLRKRDEQDYFDWAIKCFGLASCGVKDETQIHTHMCYSEFNDIIQAIAALDADVITLESSRSDMELFKAFQQFSYPNDLGPGVYDIHSPCIPSVNEIEDLIQKALKHISLPKLWVNPDCGLKTRDWVEVKSALHNMTQAAANLRKTYVIRQAENTLKIPI